MKTIIIAIIIFFGALTNFSVAQWIQVGYMVQGADTVSGGNFKGFGNNIYSCTTKGLFKSVDNGQSWQNITFDAAITQNESMLSVFTASNGNIYAGSTRRLYKSTNNGASWIWLNTIKDSISFNDICEINGNIIVSFSIGFNFGGAYYSTNEGASWGQSTGLINLPMYYFLTDGEILFLGGRDGVYKSSNNGESWVTAGSGFPSPSGPRTVIKHAGNYFAADVGGNGLFTSFDNTATWKNVNPDIFKGFCQVFSATEGGNMIIATVDGECNGGAPVKMSSDGGATWQPFMEGLTAGFYPSVGRNSLGTLFFTKKGTAVFRYGLVTDINSNNIIPLNFSLSQNYPNPFNPTTTISYQLPSDGFVTLKVYDVLGNEVSTLVNDYKSGGKYDVIYNSSSLTSGVYIYRLTVNNYSAAKKLIVMK